MSTRFALPLLALGGILCPSAVPSSRAPATPARFAAADGRTYLLANPRDEGRSGELLLVRRRPGAGPLAPIAPPAEGPARPLVPQEGDVLLSRVTAPFPLDALCLDGDAGYLLFDEFASPGRGRVLERRNARGEPVWKLELAALFTENERATLPDIGGFVVWRMGWWLDEEGIDLVVLGVPNLVLRVALADGRVRREEDPDATLLERITRESFEPEATLRQALERARRRKVPGFAKALDVLLARPKVGEGLRLEVAARRVELGEDGAAERTLLQSLAPERPHWVRLLAVAALIDVVLPAAAAPLRERLLAAAREIDSAEARVVVKMFAAPR